MINKYSWIPWKGGWLTLIQRGEVKEALGTFDGILIEVINKYF
jgi:hypothetical protein